MDTYETSIYHAVLICGVVIGAILVYFALTILRHHRKHLKLQRQHVLAEVNLLENERSRIAHDLHDELGPLLSVTQYQIALVAEKASDEQKSLNKAHQNIGYVLERLGGIATNLTPSSLIIKGLHFALLDFLQQYQEVSTLRTQLRYEVRTIIQPDVSIHLYRIIQEIVHNAVKHSKAEFILIHFKETMNTLYILCKDNGEGFATDLKHEGLGLKSLKGRTQMIGGKVSCHSNIGKGTEFFFEIPLKIKYGANKGADS